MLPHYSPCVPWVTRFSSRLPLGPRMMGSGERAVSICFTTLPCFWPAGSGLSTRSPRPSSLGNDPGIVLSGEGFVRVACSSICLRSEVNRLLQSGIGRVSPHAMQNDGQFAGDRDPGSCHAAPTGDVHAPCSEARPLLRSHQQCVARLIKRGACKFVAASADLSLDARFAGLVACRRQSQMRPRRLRRAEPLRPADRGAEGERGDRPDARRALQPDLNTACKNRS